MPVLHIATHTVAVDTVWAFHTAKHTPLPGTGWNNRARQHTNPGIWFHTGDRNQIHTYPWDTAHDTAWWAGKPTPPLCSGSVHKWWDHKPGDRLRDTPGRHTGSDIRGDNNGPVIPVSEAILCVSTLRLQRTMGDRKWSYLVRRQNEELKSVY